MGRYILSALHWYQWMMCVHEDAMQLWAHTSAMKHRDL
jgi:hypothetical protein